MYSIGDKIMNNKFKALFDHLPTGKKVWLLSEVNYKIPVDNYVQKTDWLQYVGKDDVNGNEIFEGDVFEFTLFDKELQRDVELTGYFSFGSDLSFEIDVIKDPTYVCLHYVDDGRFGNFKIVGNIHEEPFKSKII